MTVPTAVPPASVTTNVVASVRDLRVHFDTKAGVLHAVDGVSFDISNGEILGLVGETGCGKSVTARSFLRLVPTPPGKYAGGRIDFWTKEARQNGDPPIDLLQVPSSDLLDIRGNRIAMIFQDPGKALNPALPIREQLAEVFYQHRSEELLEDWNRKPPRAIRRAARQRSGKLERLALKVPPLRSHGRRLRRKVDGLVADALAETQIPNPRKVMASYPHELSGGMKQRAMIAQALACNPDLLIADEPTTALDVTIQARILELVRELQLQHRTSVLYISHDLSLVRRICNRIAVMYAGRIAEMGKTQDVFHNPLHPYTRGLLSAIPSRAHKRGELVEIEGTVPELIEPQPACRFHTRCPYAQDICGRVDPVLEARSQVHPVACHAYASPQELGVAADDLPNLERSAS